MILSATSLVSGLNEKTNDLLVQFDDSAGTFSAGQLEVLFANINTLFNFAHHGVFASLRMNSGLQS